VLFYCKWKEKGEKMLAYEFDAVVENGYIQIPEIYKNKLGQRITVTVINQDQTDISLDDMFPPIIDTTVWKFSREEANER
jgi:hypothetical protein